MRSANDGMEMFQSKSPLLLRVLMGAGLAIGGYFIVFSNIVFKMVCVGVSLLMIQEWWQCTKNFSGYQRYKFFSIGLSIILAGSFCIYSVWSNQGPWVILWGLALACGTDTCAFITGKICKGPLLCPTISPGKTWSGALGGLIGGSLIGISIYRVKKIAFGDFMHILGNDKVWGICLGISFIAILGDLLESWAKRKCAVKDSSALIPGHGGVLDRMDSILPVFITLKILHFFSS